jgi:hypothetical protein
MPLPSSFDTSAIRSFATRHKLPLVTIAAVVGILWAYHTFHRETPFPTWENGSVPVVHGSDVDSVPTSDSEQKSLDAWYDPDNAQVDPKYKLPPNLSTAETHQFILNLECLVDLAQTHDRLFSEYNALYARLTNSSIKDVLFSRTKNQQGFRHTNLSVEWQEFSDSGALTTLFDELQTNYVMNRVERIRSAILGNRYSAGDVAFVNYATNSYFKDYPRLAEWIKKATLLQQWLVEDSVITADSALPTSIDQVTDISEMIALIRRRHSDLQPVGPQAIAANGSVVANLTDQEHKHIVFVLDDEVSTILNLRVSASGSLGPVERPFGRELEPRELDLLEYMANPHGRQIQELTADVTPLQHRKDNYLLRKGMFRSIGDQLSNALAQDTLDDTGVIQSTYKGILSANAIHDASKLKPFEDMIKSLEGENLNKYRFTIGQVQMIGDTATWMQEAMQRYHDQDIKMSILLDLLRGAKDAGLRMLVPRYRVLFGLVDPFSPSPMRVIDRSPDSGAPISDERLPKIKILEDPPN